MATLSTKRAFSNIRRAFAATEQKIATDAYIEIVNRTPIDTGALKGNWNVSVDAPNTNFNPDDQIENPVPMVVPQLSKLQDVYVANGAPYAEAIENGKSRQAPGGMFKLGVDAVVQKYS